MTHPIFGNSLARATLALGAVLLFGALLVRGAPETSTAPDDPHGAAMTATGDGPRTAPAFTLEDHDGADHSLSDLAGRPVLLNFWASWCPPCLDEMPSLQELTGELAGTDLVLVAVTLDESWDDAVGAMAKTGFGEGILVLGDHDRAVAHEYGTFKVPETYLIDRQGQIVHQFIGPRDWGDPTLAQDMVAFAGTGTLPDEEPAAGMPADD